MSRSRKKTPIMGFTCAKSDKPWKAKAARSFRHLARQALGRGDDEPLLPERRWSVVNPWDAPKDGKHWVGDGEARWLRK
ncbi:hypothetical protein [Sphingobium boeckii]|uniref:Uncharacterized protein n=1 Tax=Sphingobium boeckii TaxID=1082345 RepID=A0A7W9EFP1_9SPHN|nr:hypothetical protein [Sphingobium boeckii]MBB5687513.1 hypothetical protein [Sphingobium boeckii]